MSKITKVLIYIFMFMIGLSLGFTEGMRYETKICVGLLQDLGNTK